MGSLGIKVLHTPGHTPGSICLEVDRCIFSGDTLFAGGVGRVDFPGGDFKILQQSIREKIFNLPPETRILPGHGPESTVEREKRTNPFIQDEFPA
jgi:glyoxylase-like metal-dependent hydrolase (beta-lactamase superfamily II)